MQQVLFDIPILNGRWGVIPAQGVPVGAFGAMLFVTFLVCTLWATKRGKAVGLPGEKVQDMVLWIFVSGLIGARILYMIQFKNQFPQQGLVPMLLAFIQIWKGGIIFYGSAAGGVIGYLLFRHFVLKKFNINAWQLADAMAPVLALGLAIGRIGCYLNGCCWGQVAIEDTSPVPLGGAHYPLLPAHCREDLVRHRALQSSTGFTLVPRDRGGVANDPRSVVQYVEKDSAADKAGLKPADRIVDVNDRPNAAVVEVTGKAEAIDKAVEQLTAPGVGGTLREFTENNARIEFGKRVSFDDMTKYSQAVAAVSRNVDGITLTDSDELAEQMLDWPRGGHELALVVLRNGEEVALPPFTPRSVGLYPTQLYETISMVLLVFLLVAYYPFRRHDGQLMVLCMAAYAIHRFIDESLRTEPVIGLGLTLSQWGSVVIFAAATAIEIRLRRTMPSRWAAPPTAA